MDTVELQEEQKHSKLPVVIPCVLLGILAAGYLGLCAFASTRTAFFPGRTINEVPVGGLTAAAAQTQLERQLPRKTVSLYEAADADGESEDRAPLVTASLEELGCTAKSLSGIAASQLSRQQGGGFFAQGWNFLASATGISADQWTALTPDADVLTAAAVSYSQSLSEEPIDSAYTLGDNSVSIVKARDGRRIGADALRSAFSAAINQDDRADVSFDVLPAAALSAQEVHDEVAGEMKNAGYDPVTKSITPEQMGAEFDAAVAQRLLDAAEPGQTVRIDATIQRPAVSAQQLKGVLFRDKLGTYTTHVGGSAARISNVKLASASVNGTVLNSGDVFDYNAVVGQRTAARGYQAAPAYVKGETVDEIGGGVCQPSSTLYLACLKSNLEIVERYAHRYVPAYIPKGMDATVSWGGPNYRFRNDTNYPIQVVATFSKNYLTMTLYGTKVDDVTVKMTNKVLSTTPFETVYEDDATLAVGTQKVKVTPYTGYKVETYRSLYDGNGNLISSKFEAGSDYKVRNKIIQRGPAAASSTAPLPGDTPVISVPSEPDIPVVTPPPAETPTEPAVETPPTGNEGSETPVAGEDAVIFPAE